MTRPMQDHELQELKVDAFKNKKHYFRAYKAISFLK